MERKEFAEKLLKWFEDNQREFPWRRVGSPYHILVSEILLHRTNANQVLPVYNDFIKRFPTIESLSSAPFEDVMKVVHSLGLNWRIECLHRVAQEIMTKHCGKIPSGTKELEDLPGVGRYISSAVKCFAFGYPEVLLDTNTVRILGRVFKVQLTDGSRRSLRFAKLYRSLIDKEHARRFNYAMIDLGALVCVSKCPLCDKCPVAEMCIYGRLQ